MRYSAYEGCRLCRAPLMAEDCQVQISSALAQQNMVVRQNQLCGSGDSDICKKCRENGNLASYMLQMQRISQMEQAQFAEAEAQIDTARKKN